MWRPLLRFGLLGLALFAADRWFRWEAPPPIVIPAERVAAAREDFVRWQQRAPSDAELARALEPQIEEELLYREALRRDYLRDDPVVFRRLVQNLRFAGSETDRDDLSLYREALALGLHESDVVVRRRLVQRMRFDLEAASLQDPPDEAVLRAHYEAHLDRYRSAARVSFRQLYFDFDREAEVAGAIRSLGPAAVGAEAIALPPDAFLHSAEQPSQTRAELAERFGGDFADGVFAVEAGRWTGPFASAYGIHLVYVREREPAQVQDFQQVRENVRLEVLAERRERAFRQAVAKLRADAEVHLQAEPDRAD